ncbi:MAG TPA: hypothetical protein VL550_07760 [Rhodocyclaceae bacterium]|nr:hypothetical protein [Rhodocyclaceae bacterium]
MRNRSERLKGKARGAQQPECATAHEDCEHRATPPLSRAVG